MEVDKRFNFNDPVKLAVIFREPVYKEGDKEDGIPEELAQELGISVKTREITNYDEFSGSIYILWEDILGLKDYPYNDTWVKYKGKKFYVSCYDLQQDYLVYGDLEQMLLYWTAFRNLNPK